VRASNRAVLTTPSASRAAARAAGSRARVVSARPSAGEPRRQRRDHHQERRHLQLEGARVAVDGRRHQRRRQERREGTGRVLDQEVAVGAQRRGGGDRRQPVGIFVDAARELGPPLRRGPDVKRAIRLSQRRARVRVEVGDVVVVGQVAPQAARDPGGRQLVVTVEELPLDLATGVVAEAAQREPGEHDGEGQRPTHARRRGEILLGGKRRHDGAFSYRTPSGFFVAPSSRFCVSRARGEAGDAVPCTLRPP
jgi:hypothetical protein